MPPGDYYAEQHRLSVEYERYLVIRWRDSGRVVDRYVGREAQLTRGDLCIDRRDAEVKFDQLMHDTGNLFIEIAEKRHASQDAWTPSGIMARSSAFWYIVGDYATVFVFQRERLRQMVDEQPILTIGRETSQGFLLSRGDACDYAEHVECWTDVLWDGTLSERATDEMLDEIAAHIGRSI